MIKKTKVCVFTHTFPRFSGDTAAPFMGELAKGLVRHGFEVVVLTPYSPKINFREKRSYKLLTYKYILPKKFHILGYSQTLKGDRSMSFFSYLLSPFLYFFGFLALVKTVKNEKVDIISSHWIIPNGFMASLASKICKVPFTVTIPGSDVYMASRNPFFRWMAGFAAKSAGYVISDSRHYIHQLNKLGFFPKNTELIRYGVDTNKFKPSAANPKLKKKLGLGSKDFIVLTLGRLVAKKGYKFLVDSIPKVLEKNKNARFVIVGEGEEKAKLIKRAKDLGVEKNIVFVGSVPHTMVKQYYHLADLFVMPSVKDEKGNIDASPVSMMEAMACGLPVVATKYSDGDGLIRNGRNGFLVKDRSGKAIAEAILKALSYKRDNPLGREAWDTAVSSLSSKLAAEKYGECFVKSI